MRRTGAVSLALAALMLCSQSAAQVQCTTDGQCGDANLCNGAERCVSGTCQPGANLDCDDNNVCTADSCDPSLGCVHTNRSAATTCDDLNACTMQDTCVDGICTGSVPRNCNDNKVCTTDTCNPAIGCVFTNNTASCSDGNACNGSEVCSGGVCQPGTPLTCNDHKPCTDDSCSPVGGCFFTNDNMNSCDDGNLCNGAETCNAGECKTGTALACNDTNPCTDDTCNPASGCVFSNDNTNSCADADLCNGNETCVAGSCQAGNPLTCNDSNPCTDDSCNSSTGCIFANDDANSCDDSNACNGVETCLSGVCQPGSPLTCSDNNPCTDDACDAAKGCTFINDDTNNCADTDLCNGNEACVAGACQAGSTLDCDDRNPCTDDTCDPSEGCVHANNDANSCDDGNVCNGSETCAAGLCQPGKSLVCNDSNPCTDDNCDSAAGCVFTDDDSNACADGNACNGVETCSAGACQPGEPLTCDDQNPCTDDSCNSESGCVYVNDDTNSCDDANVCNGSATCVSGVCKPGAPLACIDNNPCTDDSCDPIAGCAYVSDDTNACGDGNVCNGSESCIAGSCQPGTAISCNDNNPCTDDTCDAIAGCVYTNDNTNACVDSNLCNGTEVCVAGVCQTGSPPTCNDNNPCTDDSCNPSTGCVFSDDDSNSCSDGNLCNGAERCLAGVCQPGLVPICNDNNPCTDDSCDSVLGCTSAPDNTNSCSDGNACNGVEVCQAGTCRAGTPLVCNDSQPCTDDSCVPAQGCVFTNDNTNACGDGNACNGVDTCVSGTCQTAAPPICNDNNPCTDDSCNPATGCVYTNDNANSCDDGTVCTGAELCVNGVCQSGTPLTCNDNNPCTNDSCDAVTGCVFANDNTNTCTDGSICTSNDFCSAGVCVPGPPPNCNDNNPCTDDSCDEVLGCRNVSDNSNSCSDGNTCNGQETCQAGTCQAGTPLVCNDNNPCTDDSCSAAAGCVFTNDNSNSCSDGKICTSNDSCSGGVCVGGPPPNCNDNNLCTDDSCNEAFGCRNIADDSNVCADANVCNGQELCQGGTCRAGTALNCNDNQPCTDDSCDPVAGCRNVADDANSCSDGSVCTGIETCAGGICVAGTPPNCNDNNPCTTDTCNAVAGCVNANNQNPCDDGLFCTQTDACSGGQCVGSGSRCGSLLCDEQNDLCGECLDNSQCDDQNPCTSDTCNLGACLHQNNADPCDDGNFCTKSDACSGGQCVGNGDACPGQACDAAGQRCVDCLTDAHCTDGVFCNGQETCDVPAGACTSTGPVNCAVISPQAPHCDESKDACVQCLTNAHCSDGLFCTGTETCNTATGLCANQPLDCAALDPTKPLCNESIDRCVQCLGAANCNDQNVCTTDACFAGSCEHTFNTLPCNDGLFCTATDACSNGVCVGSGDQCPGKNCHEDLNICGNCQSHAECNDNNPCTMDVCLTFVCQHTNVTGNCNDGLFCTATDRCINGACVGFGDRCPDGECDESADECFDCLMDADCDDGNTCTLDVCLDGMCGHDPQTGPCNDGNWCTANDACSGTVCVGTGERCPGQVCDPLSHICGDCFENSDCDDQNPCTADYCISELCRHVNVDVSCEDGLFCTGGDLCVNGICVGGDDPCAGLGQCDEAADSCGTCLPPMVTAIGSRFLAVHPISGDEHPVALRVTGDNTDSDVACVALYVQSHCMGGLDDGNICGSNDDCGRDCVGGAAHGLPCVTSDECPGGFCDGHCDKGRLGPTPVFLPAAKWGTALVGDGEIRPDCLYWVKMVCDFGDGATESDPAGAITWLRGDVDGNTLVDAVDIAHIADVISYPVLSQIDAKSSNLWDCLLDDVVNALDIAEVSRAMADEPSLCDSPCAGGN